MIKKFSIGYAKPDECEALEKVIAEVIQALPYYNDTAKQHEVLKFTSAPLRQQIEEDPYSIIISRTGGEIAGFCLNRFDDYTIWLEWFGVAEEFRGNGVGQLLLNKLNETVAARNCHKIWCDCRTENKASIHILTTQGYRQLVTIVNHWYGQDFILWEKLM